MICEPFALVVIARLARLAAPELWQFEVGLFPRNFVAVGVEFSRLNRPEIFF